MKQIEDYKAELLTIFFAQKRTIVSITALVTIGAVLIAFFWPPVYSATASILIRGKKVEMGTGTLELEKPYAAKLTKEDMSSEVLILKSIDVRRNTAKYFQENKTPFKKKDEMDIKNLAAFLKNNLQTKIVPVSNAIEIILLDNDPDDAVIILNALVNQYLLYRRQVYNPDQVGLFFSQQADKFKEELTKKGDELIKLVEKTRMSDPQKEIENNLLIKQGLEQGLNVLINDAIEKELQVRHMEKMLNDDNIQFFSFIENPAINGVEGLSPKLQRLVLERGNILRTYHPLSEKIKAIERQIDDVYLTLKKEVRAYKENLENELRIANEKIVSTKGRLDKIDTRNVALRGLYVRSQRIETEAKMMLSSYEIFSRRKEEARISGSLNKENLFSNVSILSKASPSKEPVFPNKKIIIPMGIIAGFITGCSFGFLREYFDHTFKKPGDVMNYAGLPVIFSISYMEHKANSYS